MTLNKNCGAVLVLMLALGLGLHFDGKHQSTNIRATCNQNNAQLQKEINRRVDTTESIRTIIVRIENDLISARIKRHEHDAAIRSIEIANEAYTQIRADTIKLKAC